MASARRRRTMIVPMMTTRTYGAAIIARMLQKYPSANRLASAGAVDATASLQFGQANAAPWRARSASRER